MLPGVTRHSLLTLASELGYSAEEGKISTDEWREGNQSGAITEEQLDKTLDVLSMTRPGG